MSRRRRAARQDSLELLLDTICNTFGGVLFIAIMVVMLLQQAGQGTAAAVPQPSAEELEFDTQLLATLSAEVVRQRQIQASQTALVDSLVPDTVRNLNESRKKLLAEQAALEAKVDAQQVKNAALAASVVRVTAEIEQLKTDLVTARKLETESRAQLAAEQQAKVKEARLPKQHRADFKQEIGFVLRYGRVYLWHEYDGQQRRLGLNLRDFVIISDEGDQLVTRPRPTAGIPLDDTAACRTAIDKLLIPFSPQRHCICVIARPDSYGQFEYFRNRFLALGFDYRLLPTESESPVFDRGGSGGAVQ